MMKQWWTPRTSLESPRRCPQPTTATAVTRRAVRSLTRPGAAESGGRDGQVDDPWPFLNKFYRCISVTKVCNLKRANYFTMNYQCRLCTGKKIILHANSSGRTTLTRHIHTFHPSEKDQFQKLLEGNIRRYGRGTAKKTEAEKTSKQPSVSKLFCQAATSGTCKTGDMVSQGEIDDAVIKWVVETGQSCHSVEEPAFINLISVKLKRHMSKTHKKLNVSLTLSDDYCPASQKCYQQGNLDGKDGQQA